MENVKSREQRLHDLKTVYSDFHSIVKLINAGYAFDDEDAPAAIAQLEKALKMLKEEIGVLQGEWRGEASGH